MAVLAASMVLGASANAQSPPTYPAAPNGANCPNRNGTTGAPLTPAMKCQLPLVEGSSAANGPQSVIQTLPVTIHFIFWGSVWSQSCDPAHSLACLAAQIRTGVTNLFNTLSTNTGAVANYLAILRQYMPSPFNNPGSGAGVPTPVGSYVDDQNPGRIEAEGSAQQVQILTEINKAIVTYPSWANGGAVQYMIFLAPGTRFADHATKEDEPKSCAWHGATVRANSAYAIYDVMAWPSNAGCRQYSSNSSTIVNNVEKWATHEYAESVTDPLGIPVSSTHLVAPAHAGDRTIITGASIPPGSLIDVEPHRNNADIRLTTAVATRPAGGFTVTMASPLSFQHGVDVEKPEDVHVWVDGVNTTATAASPAGSDEVVTPVYISPGTITRTGNNLWEMETAIAPNAGGNSWTETVTPPLPVAVNVGDSITSRTGWTAANSMPPAKGFEVGDPCEFYPPYFLGNGVYVQPLWSNAAAAANGGKGCVVSGP